MIGCTSYSCRSDDDCTYANSYKLLAGRTVDKNECNTVCNCISGGEIRCIPETCNDVKCEYQNNPFFKGHTIAKGDACNKCGCTRLGEPVCSNVDCTLPQYQKCRGTGESIYQPGQTIIQDCKTCVCTNGEITDCTDNDNCPPTEPPCVCDNGETCTDKSECTNTTSTEPSCVCDNGETCTDETDCTNTTSTKPPCMCDNGESCTECSTNDATLCIGSTLGILLTFLSIMISGLL